MKKIMLLVLSLLLFSSFMSNNINENEERQKINTVLDDWHKSAAEANAKNYFGALTDDAIFIGTDATENWNKKEFEAFAKPFFDKGKAWDFKPIERHVYISKDQKTAWFDELLDTWMKVCRGSGVMVKVGNDWKIQHYVLSMTVPNDNTNEVIKIKSSIEDTFIQKLKKDK
ncbi:nuclear transport factor 2 family protein [Flavobacterium sp.]|uniref:nuclear transport factor 2 family protein n=1 Tax=Flavobacterium sp. TaxID=239 RepID=UPI00286A0285|nr:nuclear transport factor 2 family protein [Flavobacterium sp.]